MGAHGRMPPQGGVLRIRELFRVSEDRELVRSLCFDGMLKQRVHLVCWLCLQKPCREHHASDMQKEERCVVFCASVSYRRDEGRRAATSIIALFAHAASSSSCGCAFYNHVALIA